MWFWVLLHFLTVVTMEWNELPKNKNNCNWNDFILTCVYCVLYSILDMIIVKNQLRDSTNLHSGSSTSHEDEGNQGCMHPWFPSNSGGQFLAFRSHYTSIALWCQYINYNYKQPQLITFQSSSEFQFSHAMPCLNPGGVLSGKVGTGMCGPDRVLFRALRFCNGPFFIWKLVLI